jgi:two-component system sensor histidine kinase TrcS
VYGVCTLVTIVVLAIGTLSVYSLHTYVTTMSDREVSHSLSAFEHSLSKLRNLPADPALADFTGQAPGTLIAVLRGGRVVESATFSDDGTKSAPVGVISSIEAQDWRSEAPRTVTLGDLGAYRVASRATGRDELLVSAVSIEGARQLVATKTLAVIAISLIAAVLAGLGTVVLLRWALRPLRRVAATAAVAARIPFADEDHRITARVRTADSDPDNEVGIVGETLNRLLANVDSALAARAESDRRMRRFLSDASHELRTPLTAIQGYAQLTRQESAALPATTEYALARIESESRRMTTLVGDMLLLSRLDERQGLEIRRVDLVGVAADAVNDAAVSAPDHEWLADLPAEPVAVMGDGARLHQVISNLLSNASQHTPPGVTVTTAVRLIAGDDGPQARVTVTDDGPGIDRKLLPHLFDRFVRGKGHRADDSNGNGLGLAIVASITEAHGGTVTARSGAGSTEFRIELPAAASAG